MYNISPNFWASKMKEKCTIKLQVSYNLKTYRALLSLQFGSRWSALLLLLRFFATLNDPFNLFWAHFLDHDLYLLLLLGRFLLRGGDGISSEAGLLYFFLRFRFDLLCIRDLLDEVLIMVESCELLVS